MPSTRSLNDENAIEEERRLFYVGITRARERLLLIHAKFRYQYGKMVDQFPSRFLHEASAISIKKEDCSFWRTPQMSRYFADWLQAEHATASIPAPKIANTQATQKPGPQPTPGNAGFIKHQPVKHTKYGVGLVQNIEKSGDDMYVTVKFQAGVKKIVARFLQKV